MKFGIGQPVTRKEDPKFLTGRGQYVDDIDVPNLAFGYLLRSLHANAKINSIDVGAAKEASGVIAVLTGEDYAADELGNIECESINPMLSRGEPQLRPHPALVKDVVKCVGAPVVFVVAENMAERRGVKVGFTDEIHAEILSGVNPGERVVIKGQRSLEHGAPLKVLEDDPPKTPSLDAESLGS